MQASLRVARDAATEIECVSEVGARGGVPNNRLTIGVKRLCFAARGYPLLRNPAAMPLIVRWIP
jgi:hypothetical protein